MSIPSVGWLGVVISAVVLLVAQPLYILIMSTVLRRCGLDDQARVRWVRKQASPRRFSAFLGDLSKFVCRVMRAWRDRGGDAPDAP